MCTLNGLSAGFICETIRPTYCFLEVERLKQKLRQQAPPPMRVSCRERYELDLLGVTPLTLPFARPCLPHTGSLRSLVLVCTGLVQG
ncbi:hypothetical protein ACRRTK_009838 [Alexandromys fortis]